MLHSVGLSDPTAAATVVYPHFTPFPPTNSSSLNSNENSNHFTNNTTNNNSNTNTNGMYTSNTAAAAAAAVAALTAAAAASAGLPSNIKDSRWLTLEVCRQYQRNQCSRDENECKFAHPPTHVDVQSGRVICCYDSIKGKCQRRDPPCKYLHPPQHLREQLIQNGRNNMIMRNVQFQLLQQQLLAQTGVGPLAAAAAAAAAANGASPTQGTLPNNSNSLLYTTPAALALSNQTAAPSAYPLLVTILTKLRHNALNKCYRCSPQPNSVPQSTTILS
ncbi:Protein muscleblind [Schistosoma japonicum]|nr:Protein muscleblind [Schistosoma japonicum]